MSKQKRPTLVKGKPGPRRLTLYVDEECRDSYASFGMLAGDTVLIEETEDIRPGEVFAFLQDECDCDECKEEAEQDGEPYYWFGRLIRFTPRTFTWTQTNGVPKKHNRSSKTFFRLVSVTRNGITQETRREVPAGVIDLSYWRQSHPRPIRNLLFAEKGGA